jgi:hypothetical protein
MWRGGKIKFYLMPLIVLIYVPIKIRGTDITFWIFSLDFSRLGERGIFWHCYAVIMNLNWLYLSYELIIAYLIVLGGVYSIKWIKYAVLKYKNIEDH